MKAPLHKVSKPWAFFWKAAVLGLLVCAPQALPAAQGSGVIVNDVDLSPEQVAQLQQVLGMIVPGHYWYDTVSGLWGYQGGPYNGQIYPGMQIGGPLKADASGNSNTGVFINGRQIHALEYTQLMQRFGAVVPGRYWLNAQGMGGLEGGPATFNLMAAAGAGQGGAPGYNVNAAGGSLGSDGNCSYFMTPNGDSVMSGNCG